MDRNAKLELEIDSICINRTMRYIKPYMKSHTGFVEYTANMNLAAVAIGDVLDDIDFLNNDNIYFVYNISKRENLKYGHIINYEIDLKTFNKRLQLIKECDFYVKDYPMVFDGNIDQFHVIVFKLPKPNLKKKFIEGKYSELYTINEINNYIIKTYEDSKGVERINTAYRVLTKDQTYIPTFVDVLNRDFGTDVSVEDIKEDSELDYPPIINQEILNHEYLESNSNKTTED